MAGSGGGNKSSIATVYMKILPSMDGFGTAVMQGINGVQPQIAASLGTAMAGAQAPMVASSQTMAKGLSSMWTDSVKESSLKISNMLGGSSSFSANMYASMNTIGGKAGTALIGAMKTGALAGGAAVVGVIGVALKKGYDRLIAIENAESKLTSLGSSAAEVAEVSKNALAAVTGTAYGLDEAMTVAASAMAAGIKPGKELESYLTSLADASTITGRSLGEIGSIFNKIQTNGKVSAREIMQLSDSGLSILEPLAQKYGVTVAEMRKIITAGGRVTSKSGPAKAAKTLTSAQEELSKQNKAVADSATGIQLAEVKLAEVRANAKAKSSQILSAENAVAKAKQKQVDAIDAQRKATDKLAESQNAVDNPVAQQTAIGNAEILEVLNEKIGGAALESGNTTEGAIKNMGAAWGRFGVSMQEGFFPLWKILYKELGFMFDSLTKKMDPLFTSISDKYAPMLEKVLTGSGEKMADKIMLMIPSLLEIIDMVKQIGTIWFTIAMDIGRTVAPIFRELANILIDNKDKIIEMAPIIANAILAFVGLSILVNIATKAIAAWGVLTSIWGVIVSIVTPIIGVFTAIATAVGLPVLAIIALVAVFLAAGIAIGTYFSRAFTDTQAWAEEWTSYFKFLGAGISNFFIGALNFLLLLVNGAAAAIEGVVMMLNFIPGVNIPVPGRLDYVSYLPLMATGGDIMGPTAVIAGEKEPETITNRGTTNKLITDLTARLNNEGLNNDGVTVINHINIEKGVSEDDASLADRIAAAVEWKQGR